MSPDGSETEDRADEHPILVFVIVATIAVGLLLLLASVASGDDGSRGRPPPPEAGTPAGGGSGAELPEAAAADKAPLSGSPATAAASTAASDPIHPDAPPPAVSARAYAIIERGCGQLSFGWNEHERLAPASLTKIFTALVVARTANLDDQVAVQVSGKQMKAQGSSVMGIEPE